MKAVDLFAGLGGFTQGAAQAGVDVIWAANHCPGAVRCHSGNHPEAVHVCQDLQQADWTQVPAFDLLLASPCCQGHSKARGKERAFHDASRSTAWAVVSCCEFHRPPAFVVENVVDFQDWGLFPAWRMAMESLGYRLSFSVLDAADLGVPQNRVRLFITGSLADPIEVGQPAEAHESFRDYVDWDVPATSLLADKADATQRRAAKAREAHGDLFLMSYYGRGGGRSLDRPLGTVTTVDRWALVDGERIRMLQPAELRRAMGFPADYQIHGTKRDQVRLLGNAVCPPVAEYVIRQVQKGVAV